MACASRAEDIYRYIKKQILSGRWLPGERLHDMEIAEELNVSRISVREALFRLVSSGVVRKVNWKGYYIRDLDRSMIEQIVQMRVVLESQAVRNFMALAECSDYENLEKILISSEENLLHGDYLEYLTEDYSFHEYFHSHQNNRYLSGVLDNLQLAIHLIRYASMGEGQRFIDEGKRAIGDHRAILEAVRVGDEELAVSRFGKHLEAHRQKALSRVKE